MMEIRIFGEEGEELGSGTINGTFWRATSAGFLNETPVEVLLRKEGTPTRFTIDGAEGTLESPLPPHCPKFTRFRFSPTSLSLQFTG